MDISSTIEPKSDQINADDLMSGPRTYTIERVNKGSAEQPINVHLAEMPGRPYRPSKSMRRILVAAWGKDSDVYTGRKLTLYRDPSVRFGKDEVGGIKISHLSHIDRPMTVALTVTRGKRAPHAVEPLPVDAPTSEVEPSVEDVAACVAEETLRAWYRAYPRLQDAITARVAELRA